MRAITLLNRLLGLSGVAVVDSELWQVELDGGEIHGRVRLTRWLVVCPECSYVRAHRYDTREGDSFWCHLDVGGGVCRIKVRRRGLRCPERGVLAEGVPFARPGSGFTRDVEQWVAWLVTTCDKDDDRRVRSDQLAYGRGDL